MQLKGNETCEELLQMAEKVNKKEKRKGFCPVLLRAEKEEIADFSMVVEEILDRRENDFEVYILDNQAVQYLIPADIYHKYLDMFLVGNLGTKTPKECLEDSLLSEKQVMYLIPSDFKGQYQYPRTEVEEFIREKLNYAQTIGHFDCYLP